MNTNFVLVMVLSDLCFIKIPEQPSETGTTTISLHLKWGNDRDHHIGPCEN